MASLTLLLDILTALISLVAALPASSNANVDLEVRQTELPPWTGVSALLLVSLLLVFLLLVFHLLVPLLPPSAPFPPPT